MMRIGKRCQAEVQVDRRLSLVSLRDAARGITYASAQYSYVLVGHLGTTFIAARGLRAGEIGESSDRQGRKRVTLAGQLESAEGEVLPIGLRQELVADDAANWLEERLTIANYSEQPLHVNLLRMGFVLDLGGPDAPDLHTLRFQAIPYLRQVDGKVHDYSVEDLFTGGACNSNYAIEAGDWDQTTAEQGALRSEAWVFVGPQAGLLVIKHNQEMIEHSLLVPQQEGQQRTLLFGGAGLCLYREPRPLTEIASGTEVQLGVTRYVVFDGGTNQAFALFKQFMDEKGHGLPEAYDPPVNWNELYDVGWYHSNRELLAKHYTRDALFAEAAKAKQAGGELLYLDPGWEVCEGTTLWDAERLGPADEFIRTIKRQYGLKVGFRTIGRTYRDRWPPDWHVQHTRDPYPYRPAVSEDGALIIWEPCTQCREWQEEKLRRILTIVEAGMEFIMFDEFDWRGACYNPRHGHPVPSTPEGHVRVVYHLIEEVHRRFPHVLIEAHDPVWPWASRYLPTYWRHGLPDAYDENWGFEFMWSPLQDLLSGRALCLYYYNLAYDIPLYDHITVQDDNEHSLSFWWYASTIRHLGLGGIKGLGQEREVPERMERLKRAMAQYKRLKPAFVRGRFVGVEETVHLHTLPEEKLAALVVFNLSGSRATKQVQLTPEMLGVDSVARASTAGADASVEGNVLVIPLELAALSPKVVELRW